MKKLMKSLMSLKTKTQQSINNKLGIGAFLNGGHRPLYPFFGKSQAWMKYNPTLTKKEFQCIMVTMNKKTKTQKEHYVNNKEFLAAMIDYKKAIKEAEKKKKQRPPVTDYIGSCFLKIANHLSYRPNFINYTFRDDMISDGIENCLQYLDNFNPEKSNNPFAYFTQIIYYAFVRRIQKEKKQVTIKQKLIMEANYDDLTLQPGEDRDFKNQFTEFLQKNTVIDEPAKKKKTTKKKSKPTLEYFINENSITE